MTAIAETHAPIVAALRAHELERMIPLIQEHIMLIWSLFDQSNMSTKEQMNAATNHNGQ